ncbi:bifunctional lysylphosphatidylglycerol flippase/synthetase MprF [Sphingosinicella sp. BN140058]|uniref:bifunctional lysylphosphatidylglycerol flippase/synthetase MprF n=1 Tax=Sphingosinicella sp. BN140058 TaxID=1892855 RepID=UPI001013049A|nr:bifunctional lysylphosphatidylglycerol flippase/synthetase MprF [Sphingosinicella sp. BN140058]QAY77540.1 bifunctional lysylphosphatidylglycerol flippase/synthetase MprF [Sphingosinicella sp. BN140058]
MCHNRSGPMIRSNAGARINAAAEDRAYKEIERSDLARDFMHLEQSHSPVGSRGGIGAARHWCGTHRELVVGLAGIAVLLLAFSGLSASLREISLGDIQATFATIALPRWLAALALTALSFACLIVFDLAALRTLSLQLPFVTAARAAVTSYAISNMLGLPLLTGGAVRLNFYARAGLRETDVLRVVTLAGLSFWVGLIAVIALALPLPPAELPIAGTALPAALRWGAPLLLIGGLAVYLLWTARAPRSLVLGAMRLPLPGPGLTLAQLLAAALDLIFSAGVIYVLVPSLTLADFPLLLGAFALALAIAVLTHAPGGLGVFEAMLFLLLPDQPKAELAAALLGYRLVYFVLPFGLALVYLAAREAERLHGKALPAVRLGGSIARSLAPLTMAAAVFGAGALLIVTGAMPLFPDRVAAMTGLLPSVLLDLSHFTSSIVGTLLLFMAYGLYRRADFAWIASMVLLGAGVILALLRALDLAEAGALGLVLVLLAWTRPAFYRRTAFSGERFGAGWAIAIAGVIAASLFLGFFSYKDVAYDEALWWQVQPSADAPRFLRASLGAGLVALLLAIRRLVRPIPPAQAQVLPEHVWQRALAGTASSEAHLARTGDKSFIVSDAGDAFLMYRVHGRSFIAMGAPVGPPERWKELVWKFRELADRHGARTVFYRCGPEMLPHAIALGLGIMKLGEAACVPLADFTLDGKARAKLRGAVNRAEREGLRFRIVEGAALRALLPELRSVSDEWLTVKRQREKQFSLGRFDHDYLTGGKAALVERDGRVLAFANLWILPNGAEASFDLMRSRTDMPHGTMDFLFTRLMQWAREQGCATLSLGTAPLSGIENRRLAPRWARLASALFRHGEGLYGYAGLRRYKEKFLPEWSDRYFIAPRGIGMAQALVDVTMLVSAPPRRDARSVRLLQPGGAEMRTAAPAWRLLGAR